ncbi:MAG: beta strand repeat-containing protein, partial [Limisphaerales bacterium]
MKKIPHFRLLFSLLATITPIWICQAQTTFFFDNFSNGSTTNEASVPGGTPAASFTSYDVASTKNAIADSFIEPNDLRLSLSSATSSGFFEAQALFTTNPVELNVPGDYIDIAIVFTNTTGTVLGPSASTSSALWLGLFNSSSTPGLANVPPVSGGALANAGLSTSSGSPYASGNCALWQGYVGQLLANANSKFITRPQQTGNLPDSANQDLLGNNAGGGCFDNPAGAAIPNTGGTTAPVSTAILTTVPYTIDLRITLTGDTVETISNALYQGDSTAGTLVWSQVTTNASSSASTFLTSSFDGLGVGLRASGSNPTEAQPEMDISSILITGQSTIPTGPPTITQEPVPTVVTTNGSCAFFVTAVGDNVTYQWYRNQAKLSDGGNISGATSDSLVISPAGTADQFTGPSDGYYCVVSGAGNFSIDTDTNTLTLITSTNLIWTDNQFPNNNWDMNTTANWEDTNGNPSVFNFGDPVIINDTGFGGDIDVVEPYTSPSSITVDATSSGWAINGPGSIAGPAALDYIGSGRLTFNSANTYTGGTLISNTAAYVLLETYQGMGTGPITFGMAGGQMEVVPAGSGNVGIASDLVVADNFTILADADSSFGVVLLGNLSGTPGKTLTFSPGPSNPDTNQIRFRAYGNDTVYDGNLDLSDPNIVFASYQSSGSQTYNGIISGPGGFMQKGTISYLNGLNTYSGGTYPAQGAIGLGVSSTGPAGVPTAGPAGTGPILLQPDSTTSTVANGYMFADTNNNITIGNPIQYQSGTNNLTLDIGGTNNLTLTGPFTFYGNDHSAMTDYPTRTLQVTNTALTILSGAISDGGSNYNFDLTGSGITLFNATEAWGGSTTNSGGTMLVNGQVGPGPVVVTTNAVLGGTGTISGPVTIQNGGTLTAGTETTPGIPGIGTLAIDNTVTFQSSGKCEILINKTAGTQDIITGVTSAAYNGTLAVTNVAGALSVGNSFTIFSAAMPSGNFATIAGSPGPGLAWSFNPTNGVLSVVQGVATNP